MQKQKQLKPKQEEVIYLLVYGQEGRELTKQEVAERANVPTRTLYHWLAKNRLFRERYAEALKERSIELKHRIAHDAPDNLEFLIQVRDGEISGRSLDVRRKVAELLLKIYLGDEKKVTYVHEEPEAVDAEMSVPDIEDIDYTDLTCFSTTDDNNVELN
jgi:AcrR family transcriptional regulator